MLNLVYYNMAHLIKWNLIFSASFFPIVTIVANNNLNNNNNNNNNVPRKFVQDAIRCYSCMSFMYEAIFSRGISDVFARPENFSDQCRSPHTSRSLMTVDCQSVCINMREELDILGMPITGYIRGCFDKMLNKGFNQTIVKLRRWIQRDSCDYYNKQEVLQSTPHQSQSSSSKSSTMIYICTCFSDGCNGSHGLNGANITVTVLLQKHLLTVACLISIWVWSQKLTR